MSIIYTDALNNKFLGNCRWGNHDVNYMNTSRYDSYGGKGITVCERWNDFALFLEDMGEALEGMSIDRIDNENGYSPDNCRWATNKEQARNKTNTKLITYNGKTQTLDAWAEELGTSCSVINGRIKRGWDEVKAITTPVKHKHKRGLN